MGCKYACICGGICPGCTRFEPEEYCGHAEDILTQSHGFDDVEYCRQRDLELMRLQEDAHNRALEEAYVQWQKEQNQEQ